MKFGNVCMGLFMIVLLVGTSCTPNSSAPSSTKGQIGKADGFVLSLISFDNTLALNGSILAKEEVDLTAEITSRVTGVYFQEGSVVQRGALLFKLDNEELIAKLKQVEAKLQLENIQKERLDKLRNSGAVSLQDIDNAIYAIEVLRAEKAILTAQLAKTEIKAPWTGKIGIRAVSEGAVVSPGTHLATLRQMDKVKISFWLPERYVSQIQVGRPVQLQTDYTGNVIYTGVVRVIEPGVNKQNRSLQVHAEIENKESRLLPGSSVKVQLFLDSATRHFAVPPAAIRSVMKGKEVMVLDKGVARLLAVTTGLKNTQYVQIEGEGLKVGDTILTSGMMQVKPGSQVIMRKVEHAK
jgi:membrane fusion protein (multidrug efflux system)